MALNEFLSVPEAADALGCTVSRVRQLLRAGDLAGKKLNERAWAIRKADVDKLARVPYVTGRPRSGERS